MSTIQLKNLDELRRAILRLGWRMEQALRNAAWSAARWGEARATRETMRRKVLASQTYSRGWLSRRVADGAIIANSARHAYFVERGRKRGRMPPLPAIEEWIKLKRMAPKMDSSAQASRKYKMSPKVVGEVQRGNRRRLRAIARQNDRFNRAETTRAFRQKMALRMLALAIARKIGRRGIRAKFVLGNLMQSIGRRYRTEIRRELAKITASPPR